MSFPSRRWCEHRAALEAFIDRHLFTALAAFLALYIAVVTLSIPGAVFLTVSGGILFGWIVGGAAAVVGATIGASMVFLIARSSGPEIGRTLVSAITVIAVGRIGKFLLVAMGKGEALAAGFRANAFSYMLFLRLVPVFPFWLVNPWQRLLG